MATVNEYPLERVKIVKRWILSMISWTVLLAVLAGLWVFFTSVTINDALLPVAVVWVVLAVWQVWFENEYYKTYFYDLQANQMIIKKGVITTRETTLPYSKIQDVYVDQDILDRIFGIWDVHVSTPTFTSGVAAHIDGVNPKNATALREEILSQIHGKKRRK